MLPQELVKKEGDALKTSIRELQMCHEQIIVMNE